VRDVRTLALESFRLPSRARAGACLSLLSILQPVAVAGADQVSHVGGGPAHIAIGVPLPIHVRPAGQALPRVLPCVAGPGRLELGAVTRGKAEPIAAGEGKTW